MRLLNTETLQLEFFEGGPKLSYAILSHTWADDEVSYQDLVSGCGPSRKAWSKIVSCCAKARTEGYAYVWVDTCCIDKSSSAELSEAINSMFKWYQGAEVCYAYLADVELESGLPGTGEDEVATAKESGSGSEPIQEDNETESAKEPDFNFIALVGSVTAALQQSRWFTRGWTLQELLAPPDVVFFSAAWRELGTRDSLAILISTATKIDKEVLKQRRGISSFSVAQRMSWAARRQTSRIEDEAYCLMGLFGVSMPLLYGEGHKAFKRLQLEIMKECYDPSILAWASVDSYASLVGVLGPSPAAFEGCHSIEFDTDALVQSIWGSPDVCHHIRGSSLKMETVIVMPGDEAADIKLRAYDEGKATANPTDDNSVETHPLSRLVHFPKESSFVVSPDFFEFSFFRHEQYSLILAVLAGCKEGEHTVGITLCKGSDGLLKRVHYPTRFLINDWSLFGGSATDDYLQIQTLHISLSGTEVIQKPLVPAWTRCLVRINNLPADSPYSLSHTVPATATDAENCWYLNRWSTAVDRVTMTAQPCFSLHQAKLGRAIVFRHATKPDLSFRLVFSMLAKTKFAPEPGAARPLNLCVKVEVGHHVLEDTEVSMLNGTPDRQLPMHRRSFVVGGRYEVVVKFRRSQQAYTLAIVQVSEVGQVT